MKIDTQKPGYVVIFAAGVSAVFTAGIMALHVATADRVKRNLELREARAKVELFGLGDVKAMSDQEIVTAAQRRVRTRSIADPQTGQEITLLEACDRDKDRPDAKVIARGLPISGTGFWALIRGILALTPDLREMTGVAFLEHSETPGLGARITEKEFRQQFKGLRATAPARGGKIVYVGGPRPRGPSDPRYGRYVDAITGATGTSTAVEKFINEDLRRFRRAAAAAGLVENESPGMN